MTTVTTVDVDYTAKDGVGTLTVSTDDREVAGNLRDVFFQIREAIAAGQGFQLLVVTP